MSEITNELARLTAIPAPDEQPDGLLAELVLQCTDDANAVIQRTTDVLAVVLRQSHPSEVSLEQWQALLPQWFVGKCSAEITREEAERRRALPMDQRLRFAGEWSLSAWVYWFQFGERGWEWWSAKVEAPNVLRLHVVVQGFPYPSGALEWLLRCAGAIAVDKRGGGEPVLG